MFAVPPPVASLASPSRPLRRSLLACACVLALGTQLPVQAQPAAAAPMPVPAAAGHAASVWLEDMTWPELRDAVAAGTTTAIIPIGGTEQSGPAIAVGKHNQRVHVLAERIARQLGHTVVAPVIAYVPEGGTDPTTSHMRFPGTLSIPDDAFQKMLAGAADSLRVHGFRTIVFLGDHGGYVRSVDHVVAQLNQRWAGKGAKALAPAAYYRASSEGFNQILRQQGFADTEIGSHGGLADAALQLAVAPSMVRPQRLHDTHQPGAADGVYGGDPRRATAALGELGVQAIVAQTVSAIRAETAGHGVRP